MSEMRPELSKRNPWWISKFRYLELKYFCLQYSDYVKASQEVTRYISKIGEGFGQKDFADPTGEDAVKRVRASEKIEAIRTAALACDPELAKWILEAVTKGLSYENLMLLKDIPCCRNTYYDRYHKFFWLLDQIL